MSNDPTRIPTPIDADVSLEGGILLLNPETADDTSQGSPQSGGLFGTVNSLFRTIGFALKPVTEVPSKVIAKIKRTGGLYDERVK